MKNFPYPDKKLKTNEEVRSHFEEMVWNSLYQLNIAGYLWSLVLPGEDTWKAYQDAGASICVEYPYKKFTISLQQDSLDKALKFGPGQAYWINAERSIFHECIHILIWRMSELARQRYTTVPEIDNEEEALTDHLTNAFYALMQDYRKANKPNIPVIAKKKRVGKTPSPKKR